MMGLESRKKPEGRECKCCPMCW